MIEPQLIKLEIQTLRASAAMAPVLLGTPYVLSILSHGIRGHLIAFCDDDLVAALVEMTLGVP